MIKSKIHLSCLLSVLFSLGSLITIENLADPHSQKLLRGHDMHVTATALSNNGRLIASGQEGTKSYKVVFFNKITTVHPVSL